VDTAMGCCCQHCCCMVICVDEGLQAAYTALLAFIRVTIYHYGCKLERAAALERLHITVSSIDSPLS
jgi:hypothetical protein